MIEYDIARSSSQMHRARVHLSASTVGVEGEKKGNDEEVAVDWVVLTWSRVVPFGTRVGSGGDADENEDEVARLVSISSRSFLTKKVCVELDWRS